MKTTGGKVVLSDSDEAVQTWIRARGGELIDSLSKESRLAVMNIILRGQALGDSPRRMAQEIRPLIGLNQRQAQANVTYRERVYQRFIERGLSPSKAAEKSDAAALRYAGKQHRYRAETIVNTEMAFAYNRGAHMGVGQAIANGYMGRCEMVWTTAGTNRVCSRCMELRGRVVGTTEDSGVTIPPLHPRCRCTIMYDEVGTRSGTRSKTTDIKPRGLAAGNIDSVTVEGSPPKLIDKLENMTPALIQKTLEHYEKQIVTAPIENAIIITVEGEIFHCTGGLNDLDTIIELGERLYGAIVTHNHPVGSVNEYSFSELDRALFVKYNLARLRGVDEFFIYELNRDPKFLNNEDEIPEIMEGYSVHRLNIRLARFFKYGYRRWLR